ncbi:hypothetical protein Hena1_00360 [Erwinia phage Hena1]|uniref:Uncharacterized protein n=1 Tax=Erwinia phage Hena1 TaxID=2678601 RepID=A0A6B9JC81_9CAUD|nr:hypothetical protein HWC84_gp035 [Erwinia phage Hena1]QGZ16212.1 hypothetical protein Hena1_00360 [Erwinia phage Hena1]
MEATHYENPREKLLAIATWLGYQTESLSYGLKSPEDAIKLFDYWDIHRDVVPEMADERTDDEDRFVSIFRKDALGYDPLDTLAEDLYDRATQIYKAAVKDENMCLEDERETVQRLVYEDAEYQIRKEYGLVGIK